MGLIIGLGSLVTLPMSGVLTNKFLYSGALVWSSPESSTVPSSVLYIY